MTRALIYSGIVGAALAFGLFTIIALDRNIQGHRMVDYSCSSTPVIDGNGKLVDAIICTGNGGAWAGSTAGGDGPGDGGTPHANERLHR